MGAAYKTECYPTAADAAAAECATHFPRYDGAVQTTCAVQDASHLALTSSAGSTSVVGVAYASCDPNSDFGDVGEVWSLAALALVTVWCMKNFVYRLIAGH